MSVQYEAMLHVCYQRLMEGSTISEALSFDAWRQLIAEQAGWPEFARAGGYALQPIEAAAIELAAQLGDIAVRVQAIRDTLATMKEMGLIQVDRILDAKVIDGNVLCMYLRVKNDVPAAG